MSKHSNDSTVAEETTAVADDEIEQTDETKTDESTTDESTEKADEPTETAEEPSDTAEPEKPKRQRNWSHGVAYGVLPGLALVLAMAAGFLKWQDNSVRSSEIARIESVQAAKDTTIKLLSYKPDSVEQQLNDARSLLGGDFRDHTPR